MITRIPNIKTFLGIDNTSQNNITFLLKQSANNNSIYGLRDGEVTEYKNIANEQDLENLSILLLHYKPRKILELGNATGAISNFMLDILPNSTLTAIECEYLMPRNVIGYHINKQNRDRCTQIYLTRSKTSEININTEFDFIFINTNAPLSNINYYTSLAMEIHKQDAVVVWLGCNSINTEGNRFLCCFDKVQCAAFKEPYEVPIGNNLDANSRPQLGLAFWNETIEHLIEQSYNF